MHLYIPRHIKSNNNARKLHFSNCNGKPVINFLWRFWLSGTAGKKGGNWKRGGGFWRTESLSSRLLGKQAVSRPSSLGSPAGVACLVKPLGQQPLAASSSWPPGHCKTAAPFFHKRKASVCGSSTLPHASFGRESRSGRKKSQGHRFFFLTFF